MGLFSFGKKNEESQEKKSSNIPPHFLSLYNTFGGEIFSTTVSPRFAYSLYHTLSP